jgi:hypothetical protein
VLELLDHKVQPDLLDQQELKVKLVQLDHKVQPDLLDQVAGFLSRNVHTYFVHQKGGTIPLQALTSVSKIDLMQ